ncbi:MAG: EI24 domain-containing protein [Thiobacillus sp.]
MIAVFDALARAFRDLFRFKVLWVMIWPILLASLLWLVLAVIFWTTFSAWIAQGLDWIGIQVWLKNLEPTWVASGILVLINLLLFIPLVLVTALIITSLFAMPVLIRLVAERDYPQLQRKNGGGFMGSILNAIVALGIFIAIWVLTLPTWLIGVGVVVPFVAAAYLNQQLFRYDALSEHASREEMKTLFATHRGALWGLGLITGLLHFIPLLNLFAPVWAALAFIHFGLSRLEYMRQRA